MKFIYMNKEREENKMTISERILKVLKDRNMTQAEFAKQVGIATSTISEWKKRKTNPTADKIMDICNVLQITPEQLLTGKGIEMKKTLLLQVVRVVLRLMIFNWFKIIMDLRKNSRSV